MECNRDEATRAKEISEKHFQAKDYLGAKRFALKAQSLYRALDGIEHMLATLDVYILSEKRVNGELDWYKILEVNPKADEDTIKKQYRKLALVLHPDKNKSTGAEGAFNLISEAWSVLSDKSKRSVYDQKWNTSMRRQKVPPPGPNGVDVNKSRNPKAGAQKEKATKSKKMASDSTASSNNQPQNYPSTATFWTVCHRCRLQHEYLRMYLHRNLLCPGCNMPYYAFETPPPTLNVPKTPSAQTNHFQQKQNGDHMGPSKAEASMGFKDLGLSKPNNSHRGPVLFSETGGDPVQPARTFQQVHEKGKRDRENAQNPMTESEADRRMMNSGLKKEVSSMPDPDSVKRRKVTENQMNMQVTQGAKTSSSGPNKGGKTNKRKSWRDLPKLEIPKFLAEKAKTEIRNKLNEWSLNNVVDPAGKKAKEMVNKMGSGGSTGDKNAKFNDSKLKICKNSEPISINVPDSDFHDFDMGRTEKCFGENQIWAAYDDDDGMPRYYVLVREVISVNPFKIRISWLNSKTNTELGPLNWVGSGFLKTCGDFRIGKEEINGSLNSFSHKVKWTKSPQGIISIYPKKGDVWALYRNWSPEWNELTEDEIIHKYDMVEVLEDYDVQLGVRVTPLIKVAGFKTVFHKHLDETEVKRIPREEIFRFSHQVPSFLLSGQEGANAPKGCRELDPAATPPELLQVILDNNEEKTLENEGKPVVENLGSGSSDV